MSHSWVLLIESLLHQPRCCSACGWKCLEWPRCITFGGVVMGAEKYSGQKTKNKQKSNKKSKQKITKTKIQKHNLFFEIFCPGVFRGNQGRRKNHENNSCASVVAKKQYLICLCRGFPGKVRYKSKINKNYKCLFFVPDFLFW